MTQQGKKPTSYVGAALVFTVWVAVAVAVDSRALARGAWRLCRAFRRRRRPLVITVLSERISELLPLDDLICVDPGASVLHVVKLMCERAVGAVVVVDEGFPIGIFTKQDALHRVLAEGLDPKELPISAVMTRDLVTVGPNQTLGRALLLMQARKCRRLPVVEKGKVIGMVVARQALDPELEEFSCEQHRRQALLAAS